MRPARYRAGKKLEESSEEEDEDEEDFEEEEEEPEPPQQQKQAPPKATSFPKQLTVNRKDEGQRRLDKHEEEIRRRIEREDRERMEREAGFVTESEESEDEAPAPAKPSTDPTAPPAPAGSESEEEESSSEGEEDDASSSESSSEDDQPKLLRPIFSKPAHRTTSTPTDTLHASSTADVDAARRRAEVDQHIQNQITLRAAEKAARAKDWDDDATGVQDEEAIDDRDGLDPELEHQQWVARELGRLKRDRAALEEREAEIAEVERRRNLSTPEREAEDRATIERQKQERESKGKMGFMQKYQHKGAFFQDEGAESGLAKRDLMGARYVDQVQDKEALPEYLRLRDQSKIGKKGGTRYRDMRTEDTGQFGGYNAGRRERTGANASALGEKRRGEGVDEGPRKKGRVGEVLNFRCP